MLFTDYSGSWCRLKNSNGTSHIIRLNTSKGPVPVNWTEGQVGGGDGLTYGVCVGWVLSLWTWTSPSLRIKTAVFEWKFCIGFSDEREYDFLLFLFNNIFPSNQLFAIFQPRDMIMNRTNVVQVTDSLLVLKGDIYEHFFCMTEAL